MELLGSLGKELGAQFMIAVKSFPALEVLGLAWENLAGFDVSNINELNQVQRAMPSGMTGSTKDDVVYWATDPQFSWGAIPSLKDAARQHDTYIFTLDHLESLRKLE